jgi:hypothetical protein
MTSLKDIDLSVVPRLQNTEFAVEWVKLMDETIRELRAQLAQAEAKIEELQGHIGGMQYGLGAASLEISRAEVRGIERAAKMRRGLEMICQNAPIIDPELNSQISFGNNDDIFFDGMTQQRWHDAEIARNALKDTPK